MRNKIKQVVEMWRTKYYFIPQKILCGQRIWKLLLDDPSHFRGLMSAEFKSFNDELAGEDIEFYLEPLAVDSDIVGVSEEGQTKLHRFEISGTKHKCNCPATTVYNIGCQCGGV